MVAGISRAYSQAAANQLNTSQSSLGQLTALQNYTSQIDNLFGTTVGGLSTALQSFYSAWSDGRQRSHLDGRRGRRCSARRRALAANFQNPRARSSTR